MSITEKIQTVAENIPKVYNAGYEKGKDEGGGVDYLRYVSSAPFTQAIAEVTEDIYLDLSNATTFTFRYIDLSTEKITLKLTDKCTIMSNAFRSGNIDNLKEIEFVNDMGWVTSWTGTFSQRRALERIVGTLDLSSATTTNEMFGGCDNLQQFTPKPNTIKISISFSRCSKLTDETIQAIIDGLADLTGQTAQTLTLHATVKAKLTDEQIATITGKNWTLA